MEEAHSVINSTIEKGSLVLVTGAYGFIASHVVDQLLEAGYRVRGTVRSEEKAAWLHPLFDAKYGPGKFSTVVVPDMSAEHAFDAAVHGVSGICHVASIGVSSAVAAEVIVPVVRGALEVLKAASREPGVKSVVYTSSSMAAVTPDPDVAFTVTKATWNDATIAAAAATPDPWNVYAASKTEAERAFWKAAQDTKPPFQVAAVLPNANFGPILKPGGERESSTGSFPVSYYDNAPIEIPAQWFVDVRDTARLHVVALIDPACNGERVFAFAEPFNGNDMVRALRKLYPDRALPEEKAEMGRDLMTIPNEAAEALLRKHYGKGFTGFEESLKAGMATIS